MLYRPAFLLGYAGLLPAFLCLLAAAFGPAAWHDLAYRTGGLYAGLILSFLGGSWWALATRAPARQALRLHTIAVMPTLMALALLMMPGPWQLVLLGSLVAATLVVDRLLVRQRLAPDHWMKLRVPLSIGLAAATTGLGLLAL